MCECANNLDHFPATWLSCPGQVCTYLMTIKQTGLRENKLEHLLSWTGSSNISVGPNSSRAGREVAEIFFSVGDDHILLHDGRAHIFFAIGDYKYAFFLRTDFNRILDW